jgi:hypothetical protein
MTTRRRAHAPPARRGSDRAATDSYESTNQTPTAPVAVNGARGEPGTASTNRAHETHGDGGGPGDRRNETAHEQTTHATNGRNAEDSKRSSTVGGADSTTSPAANAERRAPGPQRPAHATPPTATGSASRSRTNDHAGFHTSDVSTLGPTTPSPRLSADLSAIDAPDGFARIRDRGTR